MKSQINRILGGLAVAAISIVFIVQFRPGGGAATAEVEECAGTIRGNCIAAAHFWATLRMLAPANADTDRLKGMGLRRQTMDGLIERNLLLEEAERLGITVTDDEVTEELANGRVRVSLPAASVGQMAYALGLVNGSIRLLRVTDPKTGKFDLKRYEREIKFRSKMSPTDFRDFQREEIIAQRVRDLIRARVHVGEGEAFAHYAREKTTAVANYVRLERQFYAEHVLDDSPEAIDAWAKKNASEVDAVWASRRTQFLPECRVARHILVKLDPLSPDAADPEKQKAAAMAKINDAIKRIEGGESFAKLAKEISEDGSAKTGGKLGCVPKGQMVKPFEDALFALEEGKLSAPVESQFGVHLIRADKIAKGEEAEKIGRAETAEQLYKGKESERLAAEAAKTILSAVQGGKSMEDAVRDHLKKVYPEALAPAAPDGDAQEGDSEGADGDDTQEIAALPSVDKTLPFNQGGAPFDGVKDGQDVASIVFGLDKEGDVPKDVIPLQTGYLVVQLASKTPATKEQWEEDATFYVASMRAQKQQEALAFYTKRLRSEVEADIKIKKTYVKSPDEEDAEEQPDQ